MANKQTNPVRGAKAVQAPGHDCAKCYSEIRSTAIECFGLLYHVTCAPEVRS